MRTNYLPPSVRQSPPAFYSLSGGIFIFNSVFRGIRDSHFPAVPPQRAIGLAAIGRFSIAEQNRPISPDHKNAPPPDRSRKDFGRPKQEAWALPPTSF